MLNVDAEPLVGDPMSPEWYTVEGELLVCGRKVILPYICIFSGSTEDLVANPTQAQYPSFRPVIVQRACLITYFTSRATYRRQRLISAFTIGAIVGSILMIFAGAFGASRVIVLTGLVLMPIAFLVRMIVAMIFGLNLRVSSYARPGIFRIRGFPKVSLNLLTQHNPLTKNRQRE